jgi:hypothetical protein
MNFTLEGVYWITFCTKEVAVICLDNDYIFIALPVN